MNPIKTRINTSLEKIISRFIYGTSNEISEFVIVTKAVTNGEIYNLVTSCNTRNKEERLPRPAHNVMTLDLNSSKSIETKEE